MVPDSAAASMIRMKTRVFIVIGTCAILVVSGILAIYWYYSAFERIKEMSILGGISRETLESGIPNVIQYTATEWWFPTANSTPRRIVETSYDTGSICCYPNGTILGYDVDGWVNRLINENQQVYSNRALRARYHYERARTEEKTLSVFYPTSFTSVPLGVQFPSS